MIVRMQTPSSQLRLVEFRQRRWVGSIRNTEDIVHSIVTIPVLHHSLTIRCKVHHLQTFTLLVICIGSLRAITKFCIDRMTLLIVTYPVNNNALTPLFIARKANYLPCRMQVLLNRYFTTHAYLPLCTNHYFGFRILLNFPFESAQKYSLIYT